MKLIQLSEDIGIKKIMRFYLELKDIIFNEDEKETDSGVVLDFSNVKRVDLSLIQVIMAADKELRSQGKRIILKSVCEDIEKQFCLIGESALLE